MYGEEPAFRSIACLAWRPIRLESESESERRDGSTAPYVGVKEKARGEEESTGAARPGRTMGYLTVREPIGPRDVNFDAARKRGLSTRRSPSRDHRSPAGSWPVARAESQYAVWPSYNYFIDVRVRSEIG